MTQYWAQVATNVNSPTVWNTTPSGTGTFLTWPPAGADILTAAGRALTVNVDLTVSELNTATFGGSFTVATNMYIGTTTNPCTIRSGNSVCLTTTHSPPAVVYVVGSVSGSLTTSNTSGISNSGTGLLYITGSVAAGPAQGSMGVTTTVAPVTVIGNVTGGPGSSGIAKYGISCGAATVMITGNVTAGAYQNAYAVYSSGAIPIRIYSGNIVNTAQTSAIVGPFRYEPGTSETSMYYISCLNTASVTQIFPLALTNNNIKFGVISGAVTGNYVSNVLIGPGNLVE